MALQPGSRLGPYEVIASIGAGGMGEVYRARDTKLDRDVALKIVPEAFTNDPERLARFQREAKVLASLNHPNIAAIYGLEDTDTQALVLELVPGSTLQDRIDQGPIPLDEVMPIARQIVEALNAAHERGIIHRDLKPANIKVTPGGVVKVLDFGLAKALDTTAEGGARSPSLTATATQMGVILGTAAYMSPEQVRGEPVGPLSDIFSIGILLYEIATGRRPFEGEAAVSVLHAILSETPQRPSALRPGLSPDVEAIILCCLEKDPARRPASAKELAEEIRRLVSRSQIQAAGSSGATSVRFDTSTPDGLEQEIRFCTTPDGVRIAYASVGAGPPVVKAANWLNHLQHDWHSPVWRHLITGLAREHRLVRYDARGNGLSDWTIEDLSFEAFLRDLETVVDESGLERFALLGISQGCAVSVAYAVTHPERVSHLILHGGFARGAFVRGSKQDAERRQALLMVTRHDWGTASPAFRQLWTSLYLPDGTPAEQEAWNDLQRLTSPENAVAIMESTGRFDVIHLLPQVKVPTLVMHSRGELAIPFSEGETLARLIPGARFVPLEGRNHLVMEHDPAWPTFFSEMQRFLAEQG